MSLSCSCDYDYEFEEGDWYYDYTEPDFETLKSKRGKRCCSCSDIIKPGDSCTEHQRVRYPYDDIESKIKTGMPIDDALCELVEIPMAPLHPPQG